MSLSKPLSLARLDEDGPIPTIEQEQSLAECLAEVVRKSNAIGVGEGSFEKALNDPALDGLDSDSSFKELFRGLIQAASANPDSIAKYLSDIGSAFMEGFKLANRSIVVKLCYMCLSIVFFPDLPLQYRWVLSQESSTHSSFPFFMTTAWMKLFISFTPSLPRLSGVE